MTDLLGPGDAGAARTLTTTADVTNPAAGDTFFGDCVAGVPGTGTPIVSKFANRLLQQIRRVIRASAISLSNPDDDMLGQAIQSGQLVYAIAGGSVNAYTATLAPAPLALYDGLEILVYFGTPNTNTTPGLNANTLGSKTIVRQSGAAVAAGDVTSYVPLIYDGPNTRWRINGFVASDVKRRLSANTTFFIATTGSDSTGTGAVGAPWRTKQFAYNFVQANYDLNGFTVTFQIADGSYTDGVIGFGPLVGQQGPSTVVWNGNSTTPTNVSTACAANCYNASYGANFTVQNQALSSSSNNCLFAGASSIIVAGAGMNYGTAALAHIAVSSGQITIAANYNFTGNATNHMFATDAGGEISASGPFSGTGATLAFTTFALAANLALIKVLSMTYPGTGSVTGFRYSILLNAVINTNGGGASYFPGNAAGGTATGGQYA